MASCTSTKHCRGQCYSTSASIASEHVLFFDCNYTALDRTTYHTILCRYYYYYYFYYYYYYYYYCYYEECTLLCVISTYGNI